MMGENGNSGVVGFNVTTDGSISSLSSKEGYLLIEDYGCKSVKGAKCYHHFLIMERVFTFL